MAAGGLAKGAPGPAAAPGLQASHAVVLAVGRRAPVKESAARELGWAEVAQPARERAVRVGWVAWALEGAKGMVGPGTAGQEAPAMAVQAARARGEQAKAVRVMAAAREAREPAVRVRGERAD